MESCQIDAYMPILHHNRAKFGGIIGLQGRTVFWRFLCGPSVLTHWILVGLTGLDGRAVESDEAEQEEQPEHLHLHHPGWERAGPVRSAQTGDISAIVTSRQLFISAPWRRFCPVFQHLSVSSALRHQSALAFIPGTSCIHVACHLHDNAWPGGWGLYGNFSNFSKKSAAIVGSNKE